MCKAGTNKGSKAAASLGPSVVTRSRGKGSETADQRKRKRSQAESKSTIEYGGQSLRRINVPPPEIPSYMVSFLQKKGIQVPHTQVVHLKKTAGEGLALFASRRLLKGTLVDLYNGELVDLRPGQTRANTDSNFGTHLQSLRMLGAVQGNGYEYIRGDLHIGADGFDYNLDFYVNNGTASFMNGCMHQQPNIGMVTFPPMLRLVSVAVY